MCSRFVGFPLLLLKGIYRYWPYVFFVQGGENANGSCPMDRSRSRGPDRSMETFLREFKFPSLGTARQAFSRRANSHVPFLEVSGFPELVWILSLSLFLPLRPRVLTLQGNEEGAY